MDQMKMFALIWEVQKIWSWCEEVRDGLGEGEDSVAGM